MKVAIVKEWSKEAEKKVAEADALIIITADKTHKDQWVSRATNKYLLVMGLTNFKEAKQYIADTNKNLCFCHSSRENWVFGGSKQGVATIFANINRILKPESYSYVTSWQNVALYRGMVEGLNGEEISKYFGDNGGDFGEINDLLRDWKPFTDLKIEVIQ